MVNKKITDLTNLPTPVAADVIAIVDDVGGAGEDTKKSTLSSALAAYDNQTSTLENKSIDLTNNTLTGNSAQLATAISDETGSGLLVFGTSPTLVTPVLGTPAAGSILTNCTGLPATTGLTATGTKDATTFLRGDDTWAVVDASPLTTKGDVYTFDTGNQRLAVGADGEILKADSTAATGLAWGTAAGGFGAQQFWVDAGALIPTPSSTAGTATSTTQTRVLSNGVAVSSIVFPEHASVDSRSTFNWTPPKNWNNGTIKIKPYWTLQDGTTTASGNLVLGFDAVAISNDDTLNATFGTAITSTDAVILENDLHVAPQTAAITVGGSPADSDLVQIRVFRDASADTITAGISVELIGFVLEYTQDASTSSG